jgi:hypothetical protein
MPTLVILATLDVALADAWERQLPLGRIALRMQGEGLPISTTAGLAAVVVLDAISEAVLPPSLARSPTIYVGEPRSLPFEQARMAKRAKLYLSYEESMTRLQELLPLLEEVAEKQSVVDMLTERCRRSDGPRAAQRVASSDGAEFWDFLEAAVENLEARDRLISEFRRASRQVLRASHTVFFLREADGFRADRGTSFFSGDDALVTFFEQHPAVIDGRDWEGRSDPIGEIAVRNRLALWGARLLVPIHDNGRLLGLIALGVRDDGQQYDETDRARAVVFARLFRQFLGKCSHLSRLNHVASQVALGAKYLPGNIVLGPHENVPRQIPLVVRELIGQARRIHETVRVAPSVGQPFRASAGIITETGGVWAFWEEASVEVHEALVRERAERRTMLRELALTLNHELGNALVSLTTFRQTSVDRPMPPSLMKTVKGDVAQLEALNTNLALMESLHAAEPDNIDIREVAQSVGQSLGVRIEVGNDPIILKANRNLLEFTLLSLIRTVAENRGESGTNELAVKVRATGTGSELTALLTVRGRNLELEGILPEPIADAVPNQGRMSVFLAKEILRLYHGDIHAGAGVEGTEILISLRNW